MGSINKAVQTFPKPLNFHDQVSAEMMPVGSITSESDRGDSDPSPVKTEPASADGRNLENVPDQCIDELSETDSSVSSGSITIGYVPSALPDNMSLSPPAYQGVAIEFSPPSAGVSVTGSSDQKQTYTVETISRWSESSGSSGAPLASIPRDINASHSTPLLEHCSLKDSPSAESQGNQSDKRDDMPSDRTKYTYTYPEFQSNATTVIIGGFGPLPKQHNENDRMPIGAFFRKFPPPSNKDYEYTTHARDPKFVYNPPKPVIPCKPPSRTAPSGSVVQQEVIRPQPSFPTRNDTNNKKEEARWRRNAIGLLPLGLSDNATDEERKYVFNEAYNVIDQPHGHCWRCDCVHIEFGPPDTLPTRDTCGAYLPGWFPAEQYQNCWKDFEGLWRDIIYLEESQRSFASTVSEVEQQQPISDKCFHAKDSKWRDMHPNSEGFWRCRNGPEATDAELSCVECHVPKRQESPDQPRNRYYYVKRNALIKWVYGCMKHMGLDDEAAAEAIVTRLGVDRITNYPYFPGTGERARESRIMPENLTLNMPEFESDGDNKGKALEILGNMPYPGLLRPRDPFPLGRHHQYKYLSGSRPQQPRFDVSKSWENSEPSTPSELKTYKTTMQDNYDPVLNNVEDEAKNRKGEVQEKATGDVDTTTGLNSISTVELGVSDGSESTCDALNISETQLPLVAPTPDRTKARSSTVSDLENAAVGLCNVLLTPQVSPTRMSRLY